MPKIEKVIGMLITYPPLVTNIFADYTYHGIFKLSPKMKTYEKEINMKPRGGYAVMSQRVSSLDELDDYPTPPFATRALLENVIFARELPKGTCLEPSCNRGFMSEALWEYFDRVSSMDIADYGYPRQGLVGDFLGINPAARWDWIITNPPFKLAEKFIDKALSISSVGIAMLVRAQFLEGIGRYERLFAMRPPTTVAQFVERVPMVKGRYDPKSSTATAYCWLVWVHMDMHKAPRFTWIPPCRAELERPEDAILPVDRLRQMP